MERSWLYWLLLFPLINYILLHGLSTHCEPPTTCVVYVVTQVHTHTHSWVVVPLYGCVFMCERINITTGKWINELWVVTSWGHEKLRFSLVLPCVHTFCVDLSWFMFCFFVPAKPSDWLTSWVSRHSLSCRHAAVTRSCDLMRDVSVKPTGAVHFLFS